ncbi:MAG: IS30 family transposase, partial [Bacteroidales bacterium]|nr:IS30 family transposase [Bacteroidales bacterium]
NFLLMMKLKFGKNATETAKAVVKLLLPYKNLVKTITTDNGSEFACHELITKKIGAKVYFADPYSSWQKGAIEHANKLIRQYIPKGSSFDEFDDEFIKKVQMKINRRPREKLNFEPPVKAFQNAIKKLHL